MFWTEFVCKCQSLHIPFILLLNKYLWRRKMSYCFKNLEEIVNHEVIVWLKADVFLVLWIDVPLLMHSYLYSMRWFCESSFCLNLICNEIGQIFLTRFKLNRLYIISFIGTFNTNNKKIILAKNVLTFAPNYSNTH